MGIGGSRGRALLAAAAWLAASLAGCDDGAGTGVTPAPAGRTADEAGAAATTTSDAAPSGATATAIEGSRSRVADNPAGWPPIEFQPASLDFGLLAPGQAASGTVRIWNVGERPLRIMASRTSCGCTTTDRLDGSTIGPGASIDFDVTLDTELKKSLGEKKEAVRIIFAGFQVPATYSFTAEVSLPVRATPPHLTTIDTATRQLFLTGEVELSSLDGTPFRVLAANGEPPEFVGFDPAADAPRDRYTLRWDLRDEHAAEDVPWFWVVETDHPEAPIVDVRVRHLTTLPPRPPGRPWVPKDQRVILGVVAPGEPVERTLTLEYQPGQIPQPASIASRNTSPGLEVQVLGASVDGQIMSVPVVITPLQTTPGLFYETTSIEVSGFPLTFRVIGRIAG